MTAERTTTDTDSTDDLCLIANSNLAQFDSRLKDARQILNQLTEINSSICREIKQNLSLNPSKISGVCGRLMCCLKNEEETYEYLNSKLPGIGDYVTTDDGLKGEVQSVNVLRQIVKVIVMVERDEKEIREYKVEQLKFRPRRRKGKVDVEDAELKKLEALEKREGKPKSNGKRESEKSDRSERQEKSERTEKSKQ